MNSQGFQNLILDSTKYSEIYLCHSIDDVNLENSF
jgi:hypothetical protein